MARNPYLCPVCGGETYRLLCLPGQAKCGTTGDRRCPRCHLTFNTKIEESAQRMEDYGTGEKTTVKDEPRTT